MIATISTSSHTARACMYGTDNKKKKKKKKHTQNNQKDERIHTLTNIVPEENLQTLQFLELLRHNDCDNDNYRKKERKFGKEEKNQNQKFKICYLKSDGMEMKKNESQLWLGR